MTMKLAKAMSGQVGRFQLQCVYIFLRDSDRTLIPEKACLFSRPTQALSNKFCIIITSII